MCTYFEKKIFFIIYLFICLSECIYNCCKCMCVKVFCSSSAAIPLKSYSPELMVSILYEDSAGYYQNVSMFVCMYVCMYVCSPMHAFVRIFFNFKCMHDEGRKDYEIYCIVCMYVCQLCL